MSSSGWCLNHTRMESVCEWYTEWLCGCCMGDPECPNYIKPGVKVDKDKQLKLFDI